MNDISSKTVNELRTAGYLVIVWTPEELGNANKRVSEDVIVEFGNKVLDEQKDDEINELNN